MTGQMNTSQKLPFNIAPSDINGTPQEVENFEVDLQGADLTFDYDPTTKTGNIVSGSTIGTFPIKFRADAKLGEGEVILEELHDIVVESVQAVSLGGTFGAPVPK